MSRDVASPQSHAPNEPATHCAPDEAEGHEKNAKRRRLLSPSYRKCREIVICISLENT